MPQMMPINWMISFFFFIMIFILFNIMNYYIFIIKTNNNLNFNMNMKNISNLIWNDNKFIFNFWPLY